MVNDYKEESRKMRVALVIGHKMTSGGASSYNGVTEFEYNEELVGMVASNLSDEPDIEVLIFHRKKYKDLPDEINEKNPDLVISFHCNAYDKTATGSEVLYYHKSKKGEQIAKVMINSIHQCLGLANRGAKPKRVEERGGPILKYTNAPCVMLEPFFIDNPLDFSVGVDLKNELSLAISETIIGLNT